MKFIGQFIKNIVARFRNDVYLESISSGTIASGGNLGLDSNNKIVKAAEPSASLSGDNFATDLKIGRDADNLLDFTVDNAITYRVGANDGVVMKASGEIEAAELDISGAIAMNSDQKLSFGHASTFIEGMTSGSKLGLYGQTDILLRISNSSVIVMDNAKCEFSIPAIPATSDGVALGSATKMWSDLFLASGGVINFNNGDATLTHSSGALTLSSNFTISGGLTFDSVALTAVQTSSESFADNDTSLMTSAAINDRIIATAPGTVPIATAETAGTAVFDSGSFSITEGGRVTIKPKAYFLFQGYGESDGSNYEMAEILSDQNAPFEHNTSRGSDGLTAAEPRVFMKAGAKVMPRGGVLTKWTGWSTSAGSGTVDIGLFKVTPTRNSTTNLTPVLLKNHQYTALGNTKLEDFDETSFTVTFAAGDMIYMAVKGGTSSKAFYVDSTLEVQFS